MNNTNRGWDELAKAIVLQACEDYKKSFKVVEKYKVNCEYVRAAKQMVNDVERFFFSEWFTALCNIDPHMILNELQRQCQPKKQKRKRKLQLL